MTEDRQCELNAAARMRAAAAVIKKHGIEFDKYYNKFLKLLLKKEVCETKKRSES